MHRQLESDDGPEACQRLLDAIANLQEPPQEEPDSGGGFTPSDGADDAEILPAEAAI